MANKKITELEALAALSLDDILVVVNDPDGTPVSYKITWSNILNSLWGLPVKLVNLTTTERNALTPSTGMLIFNTSTNEVQQYKSGSWSALGGGGGGGGATTLDELSDVVLDAPAQFNVLAFNHVDEVWENRTLTIADITGLQTALDAKQPLDSDLTTIAGLTATANNIIQSVAGTWASRTPAQLKATLSLSKTDVGLANVDNTSDANKPVSTATQTALNAKADLVDGLVPAEQLPSYVDDIIEAADFASLPVTGEAGKIYVTLDNGLTFRWSGSAYVEISASLALGETSATAYRGDRGKTAYDHSQVTGSNPHNTPASAIPFTPAGNLAADDVQEALQELDTEKQPLDADLTAIAGLTSAANKVPYFTGAGTAALADLTAYARTIIAAADAATLKALLSLVKGDVGLSNVDNTSDASKPVSTATQSALDLKSGLIYDAIVTSESELTTALGASLKRILVKGTVTLTSALTISGNNVTLIAAKSGATIVMNSTSARLTVSGNDVTFYGLIFDIDSTTNLAANTNGWIEWSGTRGIIDSCYFDLAGVLTATTGNVIYTGSADLFRFHNNQIVGGAKLRSILHAGINRAQWITNNLFSGITDISAIYVSTSSAINGLRICENQITVSGMSDSKHVVHIESSGSALTDVVFSDNKVNCAGTHDATSRNGLYVRGGSTSTSTAGAVAITGNVIRKTTNSPFDFGVYLQTVIYCQFTGNTLGNLQFNAIHHTVISGNNFGTVFQTGSTDNLKNVIVGNICRQYMLFDYLKDSIIANNNADPGQGDIQFSSTNCRACIVVGNTGFGGIIIDGSYFTVIGNQGYDSSGTPTGTLTVNGSHHFIEGNYNFTAVTMTATDTSYNGHYAVNTAAATNTSTGETDLRTTTIAAAKLKNNGDYLEIEAFGTYAANGNNKTLKFYWAGSAIWDSGALAINAKSFHIRARIYRSGATAQKIVLDISTDDALLTPVTKMIAGTATLANSNVVKLTGTGGATADISLELWDVQIKRVA